MIKERMMKRSVSSLACVAGLGIALSVVPMLAFGAPPADEQIEAAVAKFREQVRNAVGGSMSREVLRQNADAALEGLSFDEMTVEQLRNLSRNAGLRFSSRYAEAIDRFRELGAGTDATAVVALQELASGGHGDTETIRALIRHPALEEGAKLSENLFYALSAADEAALQELWPDLVKLERLLTPELAAKHAASYSAYFEALQQASGGGHAGELERLRAKMVTLARGAAESADADHVRERLTSIASYLDGPAARGQLVGNKAPALTFLWSSDGKLKSLDDLKGKVVVLDFWATWCGPCIGSFPNVRKLQDHYEGYPVAIIGVTSPQGSFITAAGERVITKDDPQKEFDLTPAYMESKGVNWTIAYTKENVFNPDYGIRGIPHVVIIDPDGKVRHRGLHPGSALNDKTQKIDEILKEFNLPVPVAETETEAAEVKGS